MEIALFYLVPFVVGVVVAIVAWKLTQRVQRPLWRALVRASVIALFFTPTILLVPIDSHTATTAVHYAWLSILGGITGSNLTQLLAGIIPMLVCAAILTGIFRLYDRTA